jgi:hypothetical protein
MTRPRIERVIHIDIGTNVYGQWVSPAQRIFPPLGWLLCLCGTFCRKNYLVLNNVSGTCPDILNFQFKLSILINAKPGKQKI